MMPSPVPRALGSHCRSSSFSEPDSFIPFIDALSTLMDVNPRKARRHLSPPRDTSARVNAKKVRDAMVVTRPHKNESAATVAAVAEHLKTFTPPSVTAPASADENVPVSCSMSPYNRSIKYCTMPSRI
jgi:hypothetical protein